MTVNAYGLVPRKETSDTGMQQTHTEMFFRQWCSEQGRAADERITWYSDKKDTRRTPILNRSNGGSLLSRPKPGDVIIADVLAFQSPEDMRNAIAHWTKCGALALVPDINLIFSGPSFAQTAVTAPDLDADSFDDEPRNHGYACGSDFDNHPSAIDQARQIDTRAAEIEGEYVGCFIEQKLSPEDSFRERPIFQSLLSMLLPGEHLVAYTLAGIDANPHRLADALKILVERRVHIHTVASDGGKRLDLDPGQLREFSSAWNLFRKMRVDHITTTTRRSLRKKKALGRVHHRHIPFGKRRVEEEMGGEVMKFDEWADDQCTIIREAKRRKQAGESVVSIAEDFNSRRLRMHDGREWATKRRGKVNTAVIKRALVYYEDLLDRGLELGVDES